MSARQLTAGQWQLFKRCAVSSTPIIVPRNQWRTVRVLEARGLVLVQVVKLPGSWPHRTAELAPAGRRWAAALQLHGIVDS